MATPSLNQACISGAGLSAGLLLEDYNLQSQMEMTQLKLARENIAFEAQAGRDTAAATQASMSAQAASLRCQSIGTISSAAGQAGMLGGSYIYRSAAEKMPSMQDARTADNNCTSWRDAIAAEKANPGSTIRVGATQPSGGTPTSALDNLNKIDMAKTPFDPAQHGNDLAAVVKTSSLADVQKMQVSASKLASKGVESISSGIQQVATHLESMGQIFGNAGTAIGQMTGAEQTRNQGEAQKLQTLTQSTQDLFRRVVELANQGAARQENAERSLMETYRATAAANSMMG